MLLSDGSNVLISTVWDTSSSAPSVPLFILQEKLLEFDAKYIRPLLERYPNSVDHHIMSTFLRLQYKWEGACLATYVGIGGM